MKVAVLFPESTPAVVGGAERLANGLSEAIGRLTEHEADLVTLPLREGGVVELLESYRQWRAMDLSAYDLVVSTKYPTWMVEHPRHVVYLFHVLRGLYDTYHLFQQPQEVVWDDIAAPRLEALLRRSAEVAAIDEVLELSLAAARRARGGNRILTFPGPFIRRVIHWMDEAAMATERVERHVAISRTVARRQGYFPSDAIVTVAYPPASLEGRGGNNCAGDHLFAVSRLDAPKRFDLLIETMRLVRSGVSLKIAGTGPEAGPLRSLAAGDSRIEFLGFVPDDELEELYAKALVVPFVPLDEDFGLITVEAARFSKPVITCVDSGGAAELVVPGRTGLVVAPVAAAIAAAIDQLVAAPELALSMGAAARRHLGGISWEGTVAALLDIRPSSSRPSSEPRKPHRRIVTVVSTFPVYPQLGGGQLRSFHLYSGLATTFDVEIISLCGPYDTAGEIEVAPGVREIVVAKSPQHVQAEHEAAAEAGFPVDDIVAARFSRLTPNYVKALERALRRSSAVVLAHPFLHPLVARLDAGVPVVYDAHNAEFALKRSMFEKSASAAPLLDEVRRIEGDACAAAVRITACAPSDARCLVQDYGVEEAKVSVVPNGSDVSGIEYVEGDRRRRGREAWLQGYRSLVASDARLQRMALFIGSWHLPNNRAGADILELAAELRTTLFVLAGSHCLSLRDHLRPANVTLLGTVDDETRAVLLSSADVALNPMRSGSGSNLKIGDYLAAGVPVVSTAVGIRGLSVLDGEHVRVASILDFPGAIRSILDDPASADAMARRARDFAEREYDWRILSRRMLEAVVAAAAPESPLVPPRQFLRRSGIRR